MSQPESITLLVAPTHANSRLDQFLAQAVRAFSRAQHQTWIKQQRVHVNGMAITRCRTRIQEGDTVTLQPMHVDKTHWEPMPLTLTPVYEDDVLLILNKPADLVMHPGAGTPTVTLAHGLLHHCPALQHVPRAGIVHRLDKNTTGLCVVAKTPEAALDLSRQLKARQIKRHYLTMVHGQVFCSGTIETCIERHPFKRTHMAVSHEGRHAVTHYTVREKFQQNTLLEVELETGRTHQIRVHMAHMQHPVCADPTYNKPISHYTHLPKPVMTALQRLNRQALHAHRLTLHHPTQKKTMSWQAPMPDDMAHLHAQLQLHQAVQYMD